MNNGQPLRYRKNDMYIVNPGKISRLIGLWIGIVTSESWNMKVLVVSLGSTSSIAAFELNKWEIYY